MHKAKIFLPSVTTRVTGLHARQYIQALMFSKISTVPSRLVPSPARGPSALAHRPSRGGRGG